MNKKMCLLSMITVLAVLMCFVVFGCDQQFVRASASKMIGEHVKFGTYQGEEIEWRVIDADDENGKVLLLSEYGLDAKPYHEELSFDIKWEDCTLRQWLNHEFYEDAFTDEEQEKILLSTSEGFPKYNSRVFGSKNYDRLERETEDYVFLLSYTEVHQYISGMHGDESDPGRLCYPTEYAKSNTDMKLYNDACGWWLCAGIRGYEGKRHKPMVVSVHGGISPEEYVDSGKYAVRPAMWIKL